MRLDEIRGKDDADLAILLQKARRDMFNFRFKAATGENERPHEARERRKTVSRILTVLEERRQGIRGEKPHVSE